MNPNTDTTQVLIRSEPVDAECQAIHQPTNGQRTGQPMNMTNQQEDKRNADQPELLLSLSHSTRNQLITSLNDLTIILECNTPIPEDAKQRLRKKIDASVRLLMNLMPFKSSEPTPSTDDSATFEEIIFGRSNVQLSTAERLRLISHLITVGDAVQFDSLISNEAKHNLVTTNRQAIDQLLDLRCKEQNDRSDEEKNGASTVQSDVSGPNEELELQLKAVTERQREYIVSLKTIVSELKQKIEKMEMNLTEISFKFELPKISKFFEIDRNEMCSNRFWCRGLQWSLCVKHKLKDDGSKQLGFYLFSHNDEPTKWSCKVDFKLILFSKVPDNQKNVGEACTFELQEGRGLKHFISYRELTDEANGYIENDKIVLGVEMVAGPVLRKS